jgi:cysteine desulfurase/selenocysteine lyase
MVMTLPSAASPVDTASPVASPAVPSAVSADASPFSAPLQFAGLELQAPFGDVLPRGLFALVDGGAATERAAPYWLAEPSAPAPVATAIAVEPFEITPSTDLGLRSTGPAPFDPHALRRQFPILEERVHGKRLVWLDNAATTQKPQAVIDRLSRFYRHENSNIHRAAHTLAARATDAYEAARESVRRFVNAPSVREIVFVRGATEGINLIAQTWGRRNVGPGDEIVITWLEHHANIVPWQQLCAEKGARLRVAPVDDRGAILLDEYEKLLGPKTRLVSLSQVSNALGTITPAQQMVELAHRHGAKVVVDGAQAVSHMHVDVQLLDCDFFVFSGHKVFAPTGIGAVFGKQAVLDAMPPWQGGGNMIQDVTFERTVYQPAPARFEAGTGNIADAVGLGTALDWLTQVGLDNVERYEHELLVYGTEQLATVPGLTIIGTAPAKAGVLSFVLAGQKTEEVGGLLDQEGIAVRSGHHCAQPILRRFGLEATVRASLAPYNTCEDIDALVAALRRLQAGR